VEKLKPPPALEGIYRWRRLKHDAVRLPSHRAAGGRTAAGTAEWLEEAAASSVLDPDRTYLHCA